MPISAKATDARSSGRTMKSRALLFLSIISIGLACSALADTLKLKNGQVIEGSFVSRSAAGIQFVGPDGTSQIYPSQDVESLSFGPVAPAPPTLAQAPQGPPNTLVPAGTVLLVRTVDALDTKNAYKGQVFTVSLSTDLAANGYIVAYAGTMLYGQIVDAESAGRATGKSKLKLQLTQIVIRGVAIPIVTDTFDTEGKSSGRRSARRLAGGAGLGAAIGAIAGNAGMGAAIGAVSGAVASGVQKGEQVQIPSETQLQFQLQQPVMLPVVQ
jgi:hypothetical protein